MATLTLDRTWLNLAATGEAISAWRAEGPDGDTASIEGQVERYAGGRMRSYSVEGTAVVFPFTLLPLPTADADTLRGWLGETVLYRDNLGRKLYGTLFEDARRPWRPAVGFWIVDLSLQVVDFDEAL